MIFCHLSLIETLAYILIPSSYKQVMEHKCWQDAIEVELLALEKIKHGTLYDVLCLLSLSVANFCSI